jgi:hypothetical protein
MVESVPLEVWRMKIVKGKFKFIIRRRGNPHWAGSLKTAKTSQYAK